MILTKELALQMLKDAGKKSSENARWIAHCICVGTTAENIAKALGWDSEKACAMGYVHDIGKAYGSVAEHSINGYNFLLSKGIDEEYASVCLTHSYLNNDVACIAEPLQPNIPFRTEYIQNHEYSIYEKLICLCDLMCTDVTMTLEKRLIDIISRKGAHENTVYHIKEAQKLKMLFDGLIHNYGYKDIYSVLPYVNWR